MAAAGKPQDNGSVERLMRTIKEEEVYLNSYDNIAMPGSNCGTSSK